VASVWFTDIYDIIEAENEDDEEGGDNDRPRVEEINDIDEEESAVNLPPPPPAPTTVVASTTEVVKEAVGKEQEAEEFAKEIRRAEAIVETYRDVTVFPLLGTPAEVLKKSKYANKFDAMFASSRAAQFVSTATCDQVLKNDALIAMETGTLQIKLIDVTKLMI